MKFSTLGTDRERFVSYNVVTLGTMHDFKPHSFDTRGFLYSLACLGILMGLVTATTYGVVLASGSMARDTQTATAADAVDTELASLREKHVAKEAERNIPSKFSVSDKPLPQLSARAFIVADMDSDAIFAQKNGTTITPIASITKLLTALVAKEELAASTTIAINESDRRATLGTPGSITRDETFALSDAFYPLLTESNNAIAYSIARAAGSDAFMRAMQDKVVDIGMTETTLEDPSGISKNNAASALDIYLLTRYLYVNAPDFLAMTRAKDQKITAKSGQTYTFSNFNTVSHSDQFLGGKIGYTDAARQTMTTVFTVRVMTDTPAQNKVGMEHETATIGIVVLGSDNRKADIEKLLRWFTANASVASSTTAN